MQQTRTSASDGFSSSNSQPDVSNVADLLVRAVRHHPSCGVHIASGERAEGAEFLSYPTLLQEAQRILGGLQLPVGSRIALLLEGPRDFIPAFWACVLGGYVPCPIAPVRGDPQRWAQHLAHIDRLLEHPLFVSAGVLLDDLPNSLVTADLRKLRSSPSAAEVHSAQPSDPAILMLTSGSTGNSKAVELTHSNLLASMSGRARRQQLACSDITFNWIAFDHVAALLESHMVAVYVGATQLHVEPAAVLTDPLWFLRLIHRHRVSLAFAPNFLLAQINSALDAAGPESSPSLALDLSCLRRIVTGGEANVVKTGRHFLDLLAPYGLRGDALWPAFGMTETCAASVYSHEFPQRDSNHEFAAVGLPIDGLELRIVDDGGNICSGGDLGELQVRGSMIFSRYYNNEEATRAAFTDDGWFRTGDVGRIEEGWLRLVARNKDSIIVNGVNYYSQELEARLEQLEGIEQSFVAVFPTRPEGAPTEQLVVMFATIIDPTDEERMYQLLVAVRNTTIMLWGFRPSLILPLPKLAFPKTSLGKIQRSLLRKRLEAGAFAADCEHAAALASRQAGAYATPENDLERALATIFAEILGIDQGALSATASFFDLGGTSLDILKLTRALERRFSIKGGLPLVLQNPSVRHLAKRMEVGAHHRHEYDPLVPLQMSGKKPPLFCVHPGNGEIFSLVNVTKYFLSDRPFFALRPRGFNEGEEHFKSIDEMVAAYVNAIRQRQPEGPYAVAGYSFGGPLAFEIGRELEARGQEVAFLGSIDGLPRAERLTLDFNMAAGLALVTDLITMEQFDELNKELRPESPSNEVCAYVLQSASPARLTELDLDLEKFAVWARVAHTNEALLYGHVNVGTVPRMTIFRSEGYLPRYLPEWSSTQKWRKALTRWDDFVRQPRYVDVSGHHHSVMGPEHVATFQAVLRSEIDRAFETL